MWAAQQSYEILGTRFRIQSTDPEVAEAIDELLSPLTLTRPLPARPRNTFSLVRGEELINPREGEFRAYRDCRSVGSGTTWSLAVSQLITALNRHAIENTALFSTHAGVVELSGRAIALPANSGGGKSTLTAACALEGFGYVSDEALCIDTDTGEVVSYPKPLALSGWSRERLGIAEDGLPFPPAAGEGLVPPQRLGVVTSAPLSLSDVVLAEFGHDEMTLERVASSEAMYSLLHFSFNHYKHGERAFRMAAELANGARAWRLRYDDPIEAARTLRDQLG